MWTTKKARKVSRDSIASKRKKTAREWRDENDEAFIDAMSRIRRKATEKDWGYVAAMAMCIVYKGFIDEKMYLELSGQVAMSEARMVALSRWNITTWAFVLVTLIGAGEDFDEHLEWGLAAYTEERILLRTVIAFTKLPTELRAIAKQHLVVVPKKADASEIARELYAYCNGEFDNTGSNGEPCK